MLKKAFTLCLTAAIEVFGMDMPEAGVTYQIINKNLVKAPNELQLKETIIESNMAEPNISSNMFFLYSSNPTIYLKSSEFVKKIMLKLPIDLGVFSPCHKNYLRSDGQPSFNQDYLQSLFISIAKLPEGTTSCIVLIIDDNEEDIRPELEDIIGICNEFNNNNIPVYINWNGSNIGLERTRFRIYHALHIFQTKFIVLPDSDDQLHPDGLSIPYQIMNTHEDLYLLLLENTILGYLNYRPNGIKPYEEKSMSIENFELRPFSKRNFGSIEGDHVYDFNKSWLLVSDKLPLIMRRSAFDQGAGFPPVMIRYCEEVPVFFSEYGGSNMFDWYQDFINILEKKRNSEFSPNYATLIPVDNESFLYFYRLHSQSYSHISGQVEDKTVLMYTAQFAAVVKNKQYNLEQTLGLTVKELCPLQSMINCGIDGFDFNKLPNEIKDKYKDKAGVISEYIHSFWKMVHNLSNGKVIEAKNWIKQNKPEDIDLLCSILKLYFQQ